MTKVCAHCGSPFQARRRDAGFCSDRCRKRSYGGTCKTCGARTTGSNGPAAAPDECGKCCYRRRHDERRWTPEAIVEALQNWAEQRGRPPTAEEWQHAGMHHPSSTTVVREMGWNNALRLAGLSLNSENYKNDRAAIKHAIDRYRAGVSTAEVALEFNVTSAAVLGWLSRAGVSVRDPAPKYSERVRRRAIRLYAQGLSTTQVSEYFGGKPETKTVGRWAREAGVLRSRVDGIRLRRAA